MIAQELNGTHVGQEIVYFQLSGREHRTDVITMVTHKKNGHVRVRAGKRGSEYILLPNYVVEVLS